MSAPDTRTEAERLRAMTDTRHPLDEVARRLKLIVVRAGMVIPDSNEQAVGLDAIRGEARSALALVERMRRGEPVAWRAYYVDHHGNEVWSGTAFADEWKGCDWCDRFSDLAPTLVPLYALPLAPEGAPTTPTKE